MKKKLNKFVEWLEKNKKYILWFGVGLGLGLLIMIVTEDDEIATLKDGTQPVLTIDKHTITADDLYTDMKDYYSVSILINTIDNIILREKYEERIEEATEEVETQITEYREYYGEQFNEVLTNSGFASEKQLKENLILEQLRKYALDDYVVKQITDTEIDKYYEEKVFGDINTKHILVKPTEDSNKTDEENKSAALTLAKEIITKLNDGKTFDEVKEEYKDSITYEELGFRAFNANLEINYINEMKRLKDNEYSKTPIETSYGYHIVYRIESKEKPKLVDVKDAIIEEIGTDMKNEDTNILYKALLSLRDDLKLTFNDSILKEKYEEYRKYYTK